MCTLGVTSESWLFKAFVEFLLFQGETKIYQAAFILFKIKFFVADAADGWFHLFVV